MKTVEGIFDRQTYHVEQFSLIFSGCGISFDNQSLNYFGYLVFFRPL